MPETLRPADNHHNGYRPDIDGLRAVAVLSVIAYHLYPKHFPGGYLGVDIFFVLSGYLITKVIWHEAIDGNFSILRFYERRIRRILPALLCVLLVVSACSILLLLPLDLIGYARSAFSALAFAANIYFWRTTDYFTQLAEEKPLLHVWSLGVEEQFYIIFPLLVILCVRWRRSSLLPIVSALVLVSLAADVLADRASAQWAAFYLLPMRAWEIGAGALLALAPNGKPMNLGARNALALVAAALLCAGLCFQSGSFMGWVPAALWVVVGTTLAIYLGGMGGSWLNSGLSTTPLIWIGLISYSLYLWHWPIFVFVRYYLVRPLSRSEAATAVAATFALAVLSWRYIERPFRDRSMPVRTLLTWVSCAIIFVAGTSIVILACQGFPSRITADVARIDSVVNSEYRCSLANYIPFGASHACPMFLPSHNPEDATVALLGNSHAQMYAPLVGDILRANNREGLLVPLNRCLPMPDYNLSTACMDAAAKNLAAIENLPRIRVVILAMTWDHRDHMYTPQGQTPDASESQFLPKSLDRLIESLERRGKTVVLVGPITPPAWESASVVARDMAFGHRVMEPMFLPENSFMADHGNVIAHYSSRSDIVFIRPDLIQCQENRCDYFRDGQPLFADTSHIAESALPLFRPAFEPGLREAFVRSGPAVTVAVRSAGW